MSERPRATILETGDKYLIGAEIVIDAPPRAIFDILADPEKHSLIDGSGSVKRTTTGSDRANRWPTTISTARLPMTMAG